MDWMVRHHHLESLRQRRGALFNQVCKHLTSDECLYGYDAPAVLPDCVIVLKNAPRKEKYKQTSLFRYFYIKKKPSQKQTTLFRYFGHSAGAA